MKNETKTAISVSGLTKCFGDFIAVDHISFDVGKGEIFGFSQEPTDQERQRP